MRSFYRRLITLTCLAIGLLILGSFWFDHAAQAADQCGTEILYFSDPAKTQQVGFERWEPGFCGCSYWSSGTTGPYRTVKKLLYCF